MRCEQVSLSKTELGLKSLDVNPTGKCNLNCDFCWGPDRSFMTELSGQQWQEIIKFFADKGVEEIIFTGGEPLLREDLPALLRFAKEQLHLRTTLSTNALLLAEHHTQVLPFVDEIGIPLDGSRGTMTVFDKAIQGLQLVADNYPHIQTTVRTVVSKQNVADLSAIAGLLLARKEQFSRWKLYQFAPANAKVSAVASHYLSDDEFLQVTTDLNSLDLPIKIYPFNEGFWSLCFY
jgi:MoaA/NifB/PqqE/SkfB family radical SAM enzyme